MIKHPAYDEDFALKRFTRGATEANPRFDWRGIIKDVTLFPADMIPETVKVKAGDGVADFDLADVADTVGTALKNLISALY